MGWNPLTWFGTGDKAVDTAANLIEKGASGIDMLFFTDEEKSIASSKVMDQVIAINKATADENSIRSKTRRFLAIAIISNYLILVDIAIGFGCMDMMGKAKFVFKVANETLGTHVLAVVIFYFGYYGIKSVAKTIKEK